MALQAFEFGVEREKNDFDRMDSGYLIAGRVGKMVIYGNNRRCYSVFLFFINQTPACYYVFAGDEWWSKLGKN